MKHLDLPKLSTVVGSASLNSLGKIVLVTELSPHGDLLGYLRRIKNEKFYVQTNGGGHDDDVTLRNLVSWCEQIACGMQHLENKKVRFGFEK